MLLKKKPPNEKSELFKEINTGLISLEAKVDFKKGLSDQERIEAREENESSKAFMKKIFDATVGYGDERAILSKKEVPYEEINRLIGTLKDHSIPTGVLNEGDLLLLLKILPALSELNVNTTELRIAIKVASIYERTAILDTGTIGKVKLFIDGMRNDKLPPIKQGRLLDHLQDLEGEVRDARSKNKEDSPDLRPKLRAFMLGYQAMDLTNTQIERYHNTLNQLVDLGIAKQGIEATLRYMQRNNLTDQDVREGKVQLPSIAAILSVRSMDNLRMNEKDMMLAMLASRAYEGSVNYDEMSTFILAFGSSSKGTETKKIVDQLEHLQAQLENAKDSSSQIQIRMRMRKVINPQLSPVRAV